MARNRTDVFANAEYPAVAASSGTTVAVSTNATSISSTAADGSAATALRSDATFKIFDTTAVVTQAIGDVAAVGVVDFAARRDHVHGMPVFGTTSVTVMRGDYGLVASNNLSDLTSTGAAWVNLGHSIVNADVSATAGISYSKLQTQAVGILGRISGSGAGPGQLTSVNVRTFIDTATTPVNQAIGDVVMVGTVNTLARGDHVHGMPSFGTNALLLSNTAASGGATTPLRSDSTIAAFDTTAPSAQNLGDVGTVGSASFATRRDHLHPMPSAASVAASVAPNLGNTAILAANFTCTNSVLVNITGLTAQTLVTNATYMVTFVGHLISNSNAVGVVITPSLSATVQSVNLLRQAATGTTWVFETLVASAGGTMPTGGPGTRSVYRIEGAIVTSNTGVTMTWQQKSSTATSSTLFAGTFSMAERTA